MRVVLFVVGALLAGTSEVRAQPELSLDTARAELDGYGTWVDVGEHGEAWRPDDVDGDWRPYTRGRWERVRDEAWLWHSSLPWGRIPFHYGRWMLHGNYGWVWIPGRAYAPSWVVWSGADAHVAWAPLPPGPCWQGDRFVGVVPSSAWVFAPKPLFHRRQVVFRPTYRRPWVSRLHRVRGYGPYVRRPWVRRPHYGGTVGYAPWRQERIRPAPFPHRRRVVPPRRGVSRPKAYGPPRRVVSSPKRVPRPKAYGQPRRVVRSPKRAPRPKTYGQPRRVVSPPRHRAGYRPPRRPHKHRTVRTSRGSSVRIDRGRTPRRVPRSPRRSS